MYTHNCYCHGCYWSHRRRCHPCCRHCRYYCYYLLNLCYIICFLKRKMLVCMWRSIERAHHTMLKNDITRQCVWIWISLFLSFFRVYYPEKGLCVLKAKNVYMWELFHINITCPHLPTRFIFGAAFHTLSTFFFFVVVFVVQPFYYNCKIVGDFKVFLHQTCLSTLSRSLSSCSYSLPYLIFHPYKFLIFVFVVVVVKTK